MITVEPPVDARPRAVLAACAIALLALEAFSVGLGAGLAAIGPAAGARFVTANEVTAESRRLLLVLAASATAAALLGVGLARRRGWEWERLRLAAHRLSPLLLAALLPALFNWRAWQGRDLHFLAVVAATALGAERLWRLRAAAPPLGWSALPSAPHGARDAWRAPRAAVLFVAIGAAAYTAYFAHHTIAFHRNLRTRSFDLGVEANVVFNAWRAGPLLKSSPYMGPEASHFGNHGGLWPYALAPLYALHPDPATLLALQSAMAGAAGVFLFLWARRHIGDAAAAVVAGCYWLYPPLHGANLFDFHYPTLAPFCVWLTLWAAESGRRPWQVALGAVATLTLREDVSASLAVIGLYLVLSGLRPRLGAAIAAASTAYFAVLKFAVMPAFQAESFLYAYAGLLPPGESSFAGVLKTVAGNPVFTLGTLLTAPKLVYLLQLLAPLAFLPLRRPLGWLFLLPGFFFTLLSTGYAPFTQISFQYTAHWTGFLFPAAVLALARASDRRPALVAMAAATLACSYQYGAVLQHNTARSGLDRFTFGTTAADLARRADLAALVARIPPRAKVVASETLVPQVCSRPDAYTLRQGVYDAEYLLMAMVPTVEGELEQAARVLADGSFGVVEARGVFAVARRGHEPSGNAAVLGRIAGFLVPAGAAGGRPPAPVP